MGEIIDLKDKVRRYYAFTNSELVGLVSSIIVIAFIISFKDWGVEKFDASAGLFNFFNAILIAALSIMVHDAGQRIVGLLIGYRIEYKVLPSGLITTLLVTFVTNGNIWIILPSHFVLHHMAGHRLGFFRYGINQIGQAMVALAGPLASISLVIILKIIHVFAPTPLLEKAILFNVVYIITSMLPIPPIDGSKIYFGSRMMYAFFLPFVVASAILLIIDINILLALIGSFMIAVLLWLAYYITFENKVWQGPK
ncbi:hypothetical protein HYT54_04005 [Candidatus Woesearchaeota archaeon]|nr:hypothetical protein [Candidatus Woesearchaeota archaeon]